MTEHTEIHIDPAMIDILTDPLAPPLWGEADALDKMLLEMRDEMMHERRMEQIRTATPEELIYGFEE